MIATRLWQVSVRTTDEGEEAAAEVWERFFGTAPAVYRDAKTGEVVVTSYPEKLPSAQPVLRRQLESSLRDLRVVQGDSRAAKLSIKRLPRENWAESWKRHFRPIVVGRRLLIKPGWSRRRAKPGQRTVILDPGLSFGTGQHPTTQFCLRQLARCRRDATNQSLLDIGCGSGILAIAAAKLGYSPVVALDNDLEAVRASRRNVRKNNARVAAKRADLTRLPLKANRRYDVICANLICDLLVAEAEKIRHWLKPGGKLVVAGILRREFDELEKKLRGCCLTLETGGVNKEWKSGRFALLQSCGPQRAGESATRPQSGAGLQTAPR